MRQPRLIRTASFLLLSVLALLLAQSPASVARGADLSIAQLRQLAHAGEFEALQQAIEASGLNLDDPMVADLHDHLERYNASQAQRREQHLSVYQDRMAALADKTKADLLEDAMSSAIEAHEHAPDPGAMLQEPAVLELVEKVLVEAAAAYERGDLLDAMSLYRDLELLFANQDKTRFDELSKRVSGQLRILRMYVPSEIERIFRERAERRGEEDADPLNLGSSTWQERVSDVRPAILKEALADSARRHILGTDHRSLFRAAVRGLITFLETPRLEKAFPALQDRVKAERYRRELERILDAIDRQRTDLSFSQAAALIDHILLKNSRSLELPEAVLVFEMTEAMMASLDEFSAVIWPYDRDQFTRSTQGSFFGVGIQISRLMIGPTVASVEPGGAGEAAGLAPGDILVRIDDQDASKRTLKAARRSFEHPEDEPLTIAVERRGEPELLEMTLARDGSVTLKRTSPRLTVVTPLLGTPAHRAGVRPNDVIAQVNGEDTEGWTLDQAVREITGPEGTDVNLGILRRGEADLIPVTLTRGRIDVDSVKGWEHGAGGAWNYYIDPEYRIGYIRLSQFIPQSPTDIDAAINQMQDAAGVSGLILDLRFNPGGLLNKSVEVANRFVERGKIVSTVNPDGVETKPLYARRGYAHPQMPVAVLINQGSASASEIVAGALQDYGQATIVGARSFGKGSVQDLFPVDGGRAYLKLTTQYYRLPGGRIIHRRPNDETWGIEPDLGVPMTTQEVADSIELRRTIDVLHHPAAPEDADEAVQAPELVDLDPDALTDASIILEQSSDPQLDAALLLIKTQLLSERLKLAQGPPDETPVDDVR